jgi:hypothetical protein
MSTPPGDEIAALYELEVTVRTELTLTNTSSEAVDSPPDPEAQRYEVGLRTLLGAVSALEESSLPGPAASHEL